MPGVGRRPGRAVAELREELRQLASRGAEPFGEVADVGVGEVVADRLHEGQVRQRELGLAAPAPEHA